MTLRYALFVNGKMKSKAHSTQWAAMVEAFEAGYVVAFKGLRCLADGCEIRSVP